MWFIFLISTIVVALAALAVFWIGSKVYLSIKRSERAYENEIKQKEKEKNE